MESLKFHGHGTNIYYCYVLFSKIVKISVKFANKITLFCNKI